MAAVTADHERGAHLDRALRRRGAHARDAIALDDQVGRLGLHHELEAGIAPALLGDEIQEIPLRHQRDELAAGRQMAEVGELVSAVLPNRAASALDLLVRQLEELLQQAELVHQLERRRMDGVAAEVAQEVGVLLQHHDVDARARQQQPQHHAGGPAANDATRRRDHSDQQSGSRSLVR